MFYTDPYKQPGSRFISTLRMFSPLSLSDKGGSYIAANEARELLARRLVQFAFFNLFIVACLGVLLRAMPLVDLVPFEYKNLLHGHSHFAFGGWVMPVLLALLLYYFPDIGERVPYKHWRNIS